MVKTFCAYFCWSNHCCQRNASHLNKQRWSVHSFAAEFQLRMPTMHGWKYSVKILLLYRTWNGLLMLTRHIGLGRVADTIEVTWTRVWVAVFYTVHWRCTMTVTESRLMNDYKSYPPIEQTARQRERERVCGGGAGRERLRRGFQPNATIRYDIRLLKPLSECRAHTIKLKVKNN